MEKKNSVCALGYGIEAEDRRAGRRTKERKKKRDKAFPET